jgi:hypothetical protein
MRKTFPVNEDEYKRLQLALKEISNVAKFARLIIGLFVVVGGALAGSAIWIANVNSALARTNEQIMEIQRGRQETLREWSAWRTTLMEEHAVLIQNQERIIKLQEHFETFIEAHGWPTKP